MFIVYVAKVTAHEHYHVFFNQMKFNMLASSVPLSTNVFDRQFHWDMVHGKIAYLYFYVFFPVCEMYVMLASIFRY